MPGVAASSADYCNLMTFTTYNAVKMKVVNMVSREGALKIFHDLGVAGPPQFQAGCKVIVQEKPYTYSLLFQTMNKQCKINN